MAKRIYNPAIRSMIDAWDGGDPWGSAIAMAFAVAEVSNAIGYAEPQDRMEYKRSPVQDRAKLDELVEDEDWYVSSLATEFVSGEVTVADLNFASRVLHRYLGILEKAGKSY